MPLCICLKLNDMKYDMNNLYCLSTEIKGYWFVLGHSFLSVGQVDCYGILLHCRYLAAIFGFVHDHHSVDSDRKRNKEKIRNEIFVEMQNHIKIEGKRCPFSFFI